MKNIAQISRREITAHRPYTTGMTASVPVCKSMDSKGNKVWVADVYVGPGTAGNGSILKDVLIASTAKELIGDIRQPVELAISKQGKYTIIGRSEFIPAGAQGPDDSLLKPTYHETKVNLVDLGLLFLADLDYEIEGYGEGNYGEEDRPYCRVSAWDAFGLQVMGEDVDPDTVPTKLSPTAVRTVTTRHVQVRLRPYADGGYGSGNYAGSEQNTLEHTE